MAHTCITKPNNPTQMYWNSQILAHECTHLSNPTQSLTRSAVRKRRGGRLRNILQGTLSNKASRGWPNTRGMWQSYKNIIRSLMRIHTDSLCWSAVMDGKIMSTPTSLRPFPFLVWIWFWSGLRSQSNICDQKSQANVIKGFEQFSRFPKRISNQSLQSKYKHPNNLKKELPQHFVLRNRQG